jgi:hypothetical protein
VLSVLAQSQAAAASVRSRADEEGTLKRREDASRRGVSNPARFGQYTQLQPVNTVIVYLDTKIFPLRLEPVKP